MSIKEAWKITKSSVTDFFDGNILKLSASLAFFTIFSLPGLLIIIIWFSDLFYGREVVEGTLYHNIEGLVGHSAAIDIQETIRNSTLGSESTFATVIALIALIIGATSVFSEIQDSINRIWRLKTKPKKGWGFLKLVFNRLLSFSMIITMGFILLVSLVINSTLDILMSRLTEKYPELTVVLVYILNMALTYFITAFIFCQSASSNPESAKLGFVGSEASPILITTIFLLGIT